ncbi:hypothetical protein O6H91_09G072300 [Diphasiastrum complanatum]|uniref:Uncharacterized protein n=1 Tax=Diphasiastrum complanatum TaxID=34168 RepID=A0ACC2CQS5_DIPCM|nr:hypothetical protein O6H91_09G072300 [Diphasiastrum complanatum]
MLVRHKRQLYPSMAFHTSMHNIPLKQTIVICHLAWKHYQSLPQSWPSNKMLSTTPFSFLSWLDLSQANPYIMRSASISLVGQKCKFISFLCTKSFTKLY